MPAREAEIAALLSSVEPIRCEDCLWNGTPSELRRVTEPSGKTELGCPSCGQAQWIFSPAQD